jgi:nucleoside-diphosphate-sugar epimerase
VRGIARVVILDGFHVLNIGHPVVVDTEWLARLRAELLDINVEDYWVLTPLPERMTLEKFPNLDRQRELLDFTPEIDIKAGVRRVLSEFVELEGA